MTCTPTVSVRLSGKPREQTRCAGCVMNVAGTVIGQASGAATETKETRGLPYETHAYLRKMWKAVMPSQSDRPVESPLSLGRRKRVKAMWCPAKHETRIGTGVSVLGAGCRSKEASLWRWRRSDDGEHWNAVKEPRGLTKALR